MFPRFQEETFAHNLTLTTKVEELAKAKGCTTAQLAVAWVRSQSGRNGLPAIIPLPGATTSARVTENATAIKLGEEDIKALDDIVKGFTPAGLRYPTFVPTNT